MNLALPQDLTKRLADLLEEIGVRAGADFSGIGLIVTAHPEILPIVALRPTSHPDDDSATATVLASISHTWHEHHDGFHVLTPCLKIEKLSQYFSPPIVSSVRIDREKRFGGRYLAALFGSAIPGVLATGILSHDFGLAVFEGGDEKIYFAASTMPPRVESALR